MMRNKPGHGRGVLLTCAIVLAATLELQAANAANISWERRGAFEVCLDDRSNDWVNAKATLVINEDPAAGDFDDMDVALWAVTALQGCEQQAGHGNPDVRGPVFAAHGALARAYSQRRPDCPAESAGGLRREPKWGAIGAGRIAPISPVSKTAQCALLLRPTPWQSRLT